LCGFFTSTALPRNIVQLFATYTERLFYLVNTTRDQINIVFLLSKFKKMPDYEILKMIAILREKEEVVLTNNIAILDAEEKQTLGEYLSITYETETADYPYLPPSFNEQAVI